MAGRRAVLRLLLITGIAFGVTWMHTIGHADSHDHHTTSTAASSAQLQTDPHSTVITAGMQAAPQDDHCAHCGGGSHLWLNPFSMCLAVLAAIGLAIALLVVAGSLRQTALLCRHLLERATSWRGPPTRHLVGLFLADLSVLRT